MRAHFAPPRPGDSRRLQLAAAVLLLLILTLAGCTGSGVPPEERDASLQHWFMAGAPYDFSGPDADDPQARAYALELLSGREFGLGSAEKVRPGGQPPFQAAATIVMSYAAHPNDEMNAWSQFPLRGQSTLTGEQLTVVVTQRLGFGDPRFNGLDLTGLLNTTELNALAAGLTNLPTAAAAPVTVRWTLKWGEPPSDELDREISFSADFFGGRTRTFYPYANMPSAL